MLTAFTYFLGIMSNHSYPNIRNFKFQWAGVILCNSSSDGSCWIIFKFNKEHGIIFFKNQTGPYLSV